MNGIETTERCTCFLCDFRHERWRFFHRPSRSSISLLSAEQRAAAVSARAFCASSCCASVCSIEKSPCWSSVSACGGGAGHGGASAAEAFGFLAAPFEIPIGRSGRVRAVDGAPCAV